MTLAVPLTEPQNLRAGDTWQWRREDLADFPASAGWALTYYFRTALAYFDVAAAADGDAFVVLVAKATTATRAAGRYDWVAVVDNGTERHQVATGAAQILPDFAAEQAIDDRSFARKLLAAVEAELTSRGSSGQLDLVEAWLDDRRLKRDNTGLMTLRSQLRAEVAREDAAHSDRNRLLVRFGNA
jgi:hypothetical protein